MKLEMAILAGDESKKFLQGLTEQIDRLEELVSKLDLKGVGEALEAATEPLEEDESDETEKEATEEDIDEDFGTKSTGGSASASGSSFDEDGEEPEEKPKAKKGKAKKLTMDDCNKAALECASHHGGGKAGRDKVVSVLKKQFKTDKVSSLKAEQYKDFVDAMKEEMR